MLDESLIILFRSCCKNAEQICNLEQLLSEDNLDHIFKLIFVGMNRNITRNDNNHPLEIFLQEVVLFYSRTLSQTVVQLPNVDKIIANPQKYYEETQLFLQLLLGCAIHCDRKVWFYEKIADLDTDNFFKVINQLTKLCHVVVHSKKCPGTPKSSRLFKHFGNFGSKSANLLTIEKPKNLFDCPEGPYTSIYHMKIEKDKIKQSQNLVQKAVAEINNKKQGKPLLTINENSTSESESDLLYKIELYKKLLTEIKKEWAAELKIRGLQKEKSKIEILMNSSVRKSKKFNSMRRHSTIEGETREPNQQCELDYLDLTATKVPQLIKLFEKRTKSFTAKSAEEQTSKENVSGEENSENML